MKKFTITKVTESKKTPGNRIFTINHTTVGTDVFKTKKSETYCLTGRNADLEVGQEVEVNLNNYEVYESHWMTDSGAQATTNWLRLKA